MMARAFDSTPKKLAVPLFGLFFMGLIVFTAGFGLLLSNKEEDSTLKKDSNRKSPLYFPYYTTLVGGIFIALLGLRHAALPSGTPSSITGALSTILNTVYFVSVGYVVNMSYYEIWSIWLEQKWDSYNNWSPDYHDPKLVRAAQLMLAGSIILTVSWGLLQVLSHFYERCPQSVQTRNLWCVIVECWKNKTTLVRDVSESVRLSSIPAILLSAVGWCVFLGGLHSNTRWGYVYTHGSWSAATITPLMYVAAVLHAGYTGKASTLMGVFASILNIFFVIGMGFSVVAQGNNLYRILHQHSGEYSQEEQDSIHSGRLMLGGGVICLVFWTVVLVLWPFYRPKGTSHGHAASSGIINGYHDDDDLLLPGSSSVAVQRHVTDNQEYTQQQLPHVQEYHTSEQYYAGNV
jgi:hypothetical protein